MKTVITSLQPITATMADSESEKSDKRRTIQGLALPWNQFGHSSAGNIQIERDALEIPEDLKRIKLFRDHSDVGGTPVGYCTNVESTETGLEMEFAISNTTEGDDAFTDVAEGVRDALSVEIISSQFDGDRMTAGRLTAVALVPVPAFEDARVKTFTASLHTETDEPSKEGKPMKQKAILQNVSPRGDSQPVTFARVVDTIRAIRAGEPRTDMVTAALADITRSAHPGISAPAWLGEVWEGNEFQREIVPTMATNEKLTSMKAVGWRWATKPTVDKYSGDKTEIPTNTPVTEAVNLEVKRIAGGHDIDRAFFDFNDAEYIASYFRAMSESYAMKTDEIAAEWLVQQATANKGAKQPDILRAAAKARQMVKKATRSEASTFLVNNDDMFSLLEFTTMDLPQYLSLVGVDPERFVTSDQVPANTVIAFNKPAAQFRELAGSPIRIEAEHLAHGGRDAALFGYYATFSPMPKGIVAVEFGTD